MAPEVRVGVGVFVLYSSQENPENPRFLMGKRLNSIGSGTYALPGGHLEFGESPEECAARELLEETGLAISNTKFLTYTNDYMPADGKHYITLYMVGLRQHEDDKPQVLEPHKCEKWDWMSWTDLSAAVEKQIVAQDGDILEKQLFLPMVNLIRQRPGLIPWLV